MKQKSSWPQISPLHTEFQRMMKRHVVFRRMWSYLRAAERHPQMHGAQNNTQVHTLIKMEIKAQN